MQNLMTYQTPENVSQKVKKLKKKALNTQSYDNFHKTPQNAAE